MVEPLTINIYIKVS